MTTKPPPCTLVVFGVTGDLTKRLLLPALRNLRRDGLLPDDFKLYCGHEYTASNVKFALTVDGDNPALKARAEEVTRLRGENKPTIPTLLGEEKKANVFLRADDPYVAQKLHMKGAGAAEVFGELRERKNKS